MAQHQFIALPREVNSLCFPVRRRHLSHDVESRVRKWTASALKLDRSLPLDIREWVATDTRRLPHCVTITYGTAANARIIGKLYKASEHINESEIQALAELL
ncbi:MAG: hypothetical protein RL701_1121 [Pseudomonadota bacterium]